MTLFNRGPLTDALLDYLAPLTGILVGDGIAPTAGGWSGGQPGEGNFVPYVVLNTSPATRNFQDPVGRPDSSWRVNYSLRSVGALRRQADWAADKVRQSLDQYKPSLISLGGDWAVLKTTFDALGAVTRNDQTDPPLWELVDTVTLWLDAH